MSSFKLKDWKIASVLLSVALLVLAFWKVDFGELVRTFSTVNLPLVISVGAINFLTVVIKAYRWQIILAPTKRVPFVTVFLVTLVGYMSSAFLPAKAGELVRVVILGRRENISKTTVLGTAALDTLTDGLGMVFLLLPVPFLIDTPDWMQKTTIVFVIAMSIITVVFFLLLRLRKATWIDQLRLPESWRVLLGSLFRKLGDGLRSLGSGSALAQIIGMSLLGWLIQAVMVWVSLEAVNLHFGLRQAIFILMAINLALLVPAAPGNVGTFEFSAVLALGYLGIEATSAMSFALVYHFVQLIPTAIAGILVLPLLGLGIRDISR